MQPEFELKILDERLKEYPLSYGTEGAAAIDLRACHTGEVALGPGESFKFSAGFAIHMDETKYAALILPRSGQGSKGLVIANAVGLIDSDYQGEMSVFALNRTKDQWFTIYPMDRIAQMMIVPVIRPMFRVVEEFSKTSERGSGGYGSTGRK